MECWREPVTIAYIKCRDWAQGAEMTSLKLKTFHQMTWHLNVLHSPYISPLIKKVCICPCPSPYPERPVCACGPRNLPGKCTFSEGSTVCVSYNYKRKVHSQVKEDLFKSLRGGHLAEKSITCIRGEDKLHMLKDLLIGVQYPPTPPPPLTDPAPSEHLYQLR